VGEVRHDRPGRGEGGDPRGRLDALDHATSEAMPSKRLAVVQPRTIRLILASASCLAAVSRASVSSMAANARTDTS
jgi:hypothetical protein